MPTPPENKRTGRPRKPLPDGLRGEIAERIRTLRTDRGWNSQQLADAAGLGVATIIRLERGDSMDGSSWIAVAKSFGLSPGELLDGCPSWRKRPPKTP